MARTADIQATVSTVLGIERNRVDEVTRRIRPHGFFTVQTKSKTAPPVTAKDCANLITALMSGVPANDTPEFLRLINDTHTDPPAEGELPPLVRDGLFGGVLRGLERDHSFVDGLALLIAAASADPDLFAAMFNEDSRFEFSDYLHCDLKLAINRRALQHIDPATDYGVTEDWATFLQEVTVSYSGSLRAPPFETIHRGWFNILATLGRALREGKPC